MVTSATIETHRFAEYFGGAPVIEVEGRSHPVELRYRPTDPDDETAAPLAGAVLRAAAKSSLHDPAASAGDALVFLPGEQQIHEALELLRRDAPGGARTAAALFASVVRGAGARICAARRAAGHPGHQRRRDLADDSRAYASSSTPGSRASAVTARAPRCSDCRSSRFRAPAPTSARGVAGAKARVSASVSTAESRFRASARSTPSPRSTAPISRA